MFEARQHPDGTWHVYQLGKERADDRRICAAVGEEVARVTASMLTTSELGLPPDATNLAVGDAAMARFNERERKKP